MRRNLLGQAVGERLKRLLQLRQEIDKLYEEHNPDKLAEVDQLVEKYGEDRLLSLIRKKYGVDGGGAAAS